MKESEPILSPAETAKSEQVLILPGHLFFIEAIEVPVELEASEIQDFAELSLESIAPFPIEQLNWGYLYSENAPNILLYATHRDRLKNAGYAQLETYAWVIPDFATLSGACFPEDTLVALESAHSVSLLHFEKGTGIPTSIWVAALEECEPEQVLKALKARATDLPRTAPTLKLRPITATLNEQGIPTFEQAPVEPETDRRDYGTWRSLTATETQLWQTDVRSADFKNTERSTRRTSALIERIAEWAAIFALVLIGGEIVLFACQSWLGTLHSKIESQRTAVLRIEDKQTLINKLEQVAQNELRPIAILEAANNVRLKLNLGIEYDSTIIEGENHITIEGKASSINALNSYTDSLKKSGQFELLATPEYITRAGKTTFTVTLAYKNIETIPSAATPEPAKPQETIEETEI